MMNSDEKSQFSDDIPPSDSTPRNNSVFTFDDDNLLLSVNIRIQGYYHRIVRNHTIEQDLH